jgi:hypothetical protein
MDQQGVNCVVDGVDHVFSFAILLRGVGAREAQLDTAGREEAGGSMIDEFIAIVSLK